MEEDIPCKNREIIDTRLQQKECTGFIECRRFLFSEAFAILSIVTTFILHLKMEAI
jgi:hypothetical protein